MSPDVTITGTLASKANCRASFRPSPPTSRQSSTTRSGRTRRKKRSERITNSLLSHFRGPAHIITLARLLPNPPLPGCVIDAPPGRLACELIIRIYVSHECLASRGLHVHVACRSYVSLIREVERCELRNAVADRQSRCHRKIWASRSAGAHILDKTTNVRSIVESRRGAGGSRCITRRRRRCGRRRGLLWRARSDRETGYT